MAQQDVDSFLGSGPGEQQPQGSASPSSLDSFLGSGPGEAAAPAVPSGSYAGHLAALTGQGLARGAYESIAGAPSSTSTLFENYIRPHLPAFLSEARAPQTPDEKDFLQKLQQTQDATTPSPAQISSNETSYGINSAKPDGLGENLLTRGAEGVGAAVPALLGGGVNSLRAGLTTLASGGAGGLAAEGAKQLGAPGWVQLIAGLAPGFALGGWQGAKEAAAKADAAATELAAAKQSHESANELLKGGDNNVGGNPLTTVKKDTTDALEKFTTAQGQARDATNLAISEEARRRVALANSAIEGVANAHGTSASLQDAGTALQAHGREWLQTQFPAKQEAAWAPVDSAVPGNAKTPLTNFSSALSSITNSAGDLEPLAAKLRPALPQQLKSILESKFETPSGNPAKPAQMGPSSILDSSGTPLQKVVSPAQPEQPIVWDDVRKLRSVLGNAMSDPKTVNDVGRANVANLYRALTQDLGNTALLHDASDAFDQANAQSKRLYDIAEGPLAKVIGDKTGESLRYDPAAGKVAQSLLNSAKTGDTQLEALKSEGFPVSELTAAKLREDPEGAQKWWDSLSPEGQKSLVPNPVHRTVLQDMLAEREQAPKDAKVLGKIADAQHDVAVAEAKASAKSTVDATHDSMKQSVDAAHSRLVQAQAAFDALPKDDRVVGMLQRLRHSPVGSLAGLTVNGALTYGGVIPELHSAIPMVGEAAGTALLGMGAGKIASNVYQGAKNVLTNPTPQNLAAPGAALLGASTGLLGSKPATP